MGINYYEFKDETCAAEWVNTNYKNFIDNIQENSNISGTLGDALFCYTGSMSKDYNNILRFNNGSIVNIDYIIEKYYINKFNNCSENSYIEKSLCSFLINEAKSDIKIIYNTFSLNSINDNILLFHYFNINYLGKELLNKIHFEINNFISTTMIRKSFGMNELINKNNYDSLLSIRVKKGAECIPIWNNPNSHLKEYEIILKPKSKFKIINIKRKYFNKIKYIIECELI